LASFLLQFTIRDSVMGFDGSISPHPDDVYKELGPTALFLKTTTARKAAVLEASRAAKEREEGNAEMTYTRRLLRIKKALQESRLSGQFRLHPMLPALQTGESEFAGFFERGSIFGIALNDLLNEAEDLEISVQDEILDRGFKRHFDDDFRSLLGPMKMSKKSIMESIDRKIGEAPQVKKQVFVGDKSLLQRESLSRSPKFEALCTVIWLAADVDACNTITKSNYLALCRKLRIALLGFDGGEKLAERDWKKDSKAQGFLSFRTFVSAFFVLADMFAEHLTEDSFVDFLEMIAERIVKVKKQGHLALREDNAVISCKVFRFLRGEHPSWRAFPEFRSAAKVRKAFGRNVDQIENLNLVEMQTDA